MRHCDSTRGPFFACTATQKCTCMAEVLFKCVWKRFRWVTQDRTIRRFGSNVKVSSRKIRELSFSYYYVYRYVIVPWNEQYRDWLLLYQIQYQYYYGDRNEREVANKIPKDFADKATFRWKGDRALWINLDGSVGLEADRLWGHFSWSGDCVIWENSRECRIDGPLLQGFLLQDSQLYTLWSDVIAFTVVTGVRGIGR